MNNERYRDPTADKAIEHVMREAEWIPEQVYDVIEVLKRVLKLRNMRFRYIELEDDSGNVYRKRWRR